MWSCALQIFFVFTTFPSAGAFVVPADAPTFCGIETRRIFGFTHVHNLRNQEIFGIFGAEPGNDGPCH